MGPKPAIDSVQRPKADQNHLVPAMNGFEPSLVVESANYQILQYERLQEVIIMRRTNITTNHRLAVNFLVSGG